MPIKTTSTDSSNYSYSQSWNAGLFCLFTCLKRWNVAVFSVPVVIGNGRILNNLWIDSLYLLHILHRRTFVSA